jgi:hypothetical protein
MSNCICATTRPKSGTKRPNTPASFIQRSTVSGSRGEVSTSRNKALARGIGAHLIVDQLGVAAAARIASGWISSRSVGEREDLDQAHRILGEEVVAGSASRPRSSTKPSSLRGRRRIVGKAEAAAALGELLVEVGEEDAGQVADRFRVQEIMRMKRSTGDLPGRSA